MSKEPEHRRTRRPGDYITNWLKPLLVARWRMGPTKIMRSGGSKDSPWLREQALEMGACGCWLLATGYWLAACARGCVS